jgi:hypothetical protein
VRYVPIAHALYTALKRLRHDILSATRIRSNRAAQNLVVNLMNVPMSERPAAFSSLLPKILEMRLRTARPHCLVIDEAHRLLPPSWSPASDTIPQQLSGTILITVHPERVAPTVLAFVDTVLATRQRRR